MVFFTLTAVLSGLFFVPVQGGVVSNWTHGGNLGPNHWPLTFPACGGNVQSPINIDILDVQLDEDLQHFDLSGLSKTKGIEMTLVNVQGHTVEVILDGESQLVSGGGLQGQYKVAQFHFHWGGVDGRGSEHSINDRLHPGEMHIVLFSALYTDLSSALKNAEGVAVLGFFFKVGEHNVEFDHLLSYFGYVSHSDQTKVINTFSIRNLLPPFCRTYYRYGGSLTTPPCYETVIWTLFKEEIEISEPQLEKFRRIKRNQCGEREEELVDNFRPVQKLNGRRITTNLRTGLVYDSSAHSCFSVIPLLLTFLYACVIQRLLH